jgi:S-DNA-T family DNA segregation ATPase FtsK/SpoIIIE
MGNTRRLRAMCFPETIDDEDVDVMKNDKLGAEVQSPARERRRVSYHDMMFDVFYGEVGEVNRKMALPMVLGKILCGSSLVRNLAKLPQLLIAGATGRGKSVFLHSFLCSLIQNKSPEEVRFVLMDPKRVEFNAYADLPHLLTPLVYDAKEGCKALKKIAEEMDRRFRMFTEAKCGDIVTFNEGNNKEKLPYLVVIVDELSDFMIQTHERFLALSIRIAALGRAAGIHLVMATSRLDRNVLPAELKVNIPARLAFTVSCKADSRTILDADGAESLNGSGDALFRDNTGELIRLQAPYIDSKDVERIVAEVIRKYPGREVSFRCKGIWGRRKEVPAPACQDTLYLRAVELIRKTGRASISHLQRQLGIGYNDAAKIIDLLEERGIITPPKAPNGQREILN